MLVRSQIRERYGMTDSLIDKLGEPDEERVNPHYRSGPSMKLFKVSRVERFAKRHRDTIAVMVAKRDGRRAASRKAVETKMDKLMSEIDDIGLDISSALPEKYKDLLAIASRHARERYGDRASQPGYNGACATLRHEFTNYHQLLQMAFGRVGKQDAYDSIRNSLDKQIETLMKERYGVQRPLELSRGQVPDKQEPVSTSIPTTAD